MKSVELDAARSPFRAWLSSLGADADAAVAAALAYASMPESARSAFLDAVDEEAEALCIARVALYGPFLAIESAPHLRDRLKARVESEETQVWNHGDRRLRAFQSEQSGRLVVIARPLYLDFVELLVCEVSEHGGLVEVRRDPLRHAEVLDLTRLSIVVRQEMIEVSLDHAVERLAYAILAHERLGGTIPQELRGFADLFGVPSE